MKKAGISIIMIVYLITGTMNAQDGKKSRSAHKKAHKDSVKAVKDMEKGNDSGEEKNIKKEGAAINKNNK